MSKAPLWGTLLAIAILAGMPRADTPGPASDSPEYTEKNELRRPGNYRDWIYLSSGLGMNYNVAAGDHETFTNVFVPQWAYREFVATGKWPDKTIFLVERTDVSHEGFDQ
jgi:hypothetical protein